MIDKVLLYLYPGAKYILNGDSYDGLEWLDKTTQKPSRAEIEAGVEFINNHLSLLEYRDYRRKAYPPVGDQLDALYHAGLFPTEMAEKIRAVKEMYPKPEGDLVFSPSEET